MFEPNTWNIANSNDETGNPIVSDRCDENSLDWPCHVRIFLCATRWNRRHGDNSALKDVLFVSRALGERDRSRGVLASQTTGMFAFRTGPFSPAEPSKRDEVDSQFPEEKQRRKKNGQGFHELIVGEEYTA